MRLDSRQAWVVGIGGSLILAAVAIFAAVPKSTPPVETSDLYGELVSARLSPLEGYLEPAAPSVRELMAEPTPTATAAAVSPVERLAIPSLRVDAPVVAGNLTADRQMVDPPDAVTVVWYDFTGSPGQGGNAVFSGHLDYAGYGPAVFWNLKNLRPGDTAQIRLADGTLLDYSVTGMQLYAVQTMPMREILASTTSESITLITCGGTFSNGEYSHRLVVRAVRVQEN